MRGIGDPAGTPFGGVAYSVQGNVRCGLQLLVYCRLQYLEQRPHCDHEVVEVDQRVLPCGGQVVRHGGREGQPQGGVVSGGGDGDGARLGAPAGV